MATTIQSSTSSPVPTTPPPSLEPRRGQYSALRHANFRLYFAGQLVSSSGTWMQVVAQSWLIYNLTGQASWLGISACATGLPSIILSPFAGVVVERLPRKNILVLTQTGQMLLAFILSALTFAQVVQPWHVMVLAFLLGITNSIDAPCRQAFVIDMVGREDLTSGITLNSLMFNVSRVIGPSAAGLALVKVGPGWCFFLNGASFLAVIVSLLLMRIQNYSQQIASLSPLGQLREGVQFARTHITIAPLLLLATNASVFGSNVATLLPAFAGDVLHSPDSGYAALVTANGVGALCAAASVTWLGTRLGRGRLLTIMSSLVSGFIVLLALTNVLQIALVLTLLMGFSLILQFIAMNTLLQTQVPDEFRGRVLSLYTLTFFGLAPFGALLLGFIAQTTGTPGAFILCAVLGGIINTVILARAGALRRLQ